jgi:hypothetical protein
VKYRPQRWVPSYEVPGKPELSLMDMAISQCPRSFVSEESIFWVEEYYRIQQATKATQSPYSPSLVESDARFVEAMMVIEQESISLKNLLEAESR